MACSLQVKDQAMRNLVIWNVVVAAVLGGLYGVLLHLVLGKSGVGRTALKTIVIILLTGATTPYVAPALRGFAAPLLPKSRVERAVESFEARLAALPEWQERTRGRSHKEGLDIAYDVGFRGVSRLDDESLAVAELKGRQVVAPSSRETAEALLLLLARMPPKDAELLRRTVTGMKRADDEHACWAARTVYHYLPLLPDEPRRDLTRALFTS